MLYRRLPRLKKVKSDRAGGFLPLWTVGLPSRQPVRSPLSPRDAVPSIISTFI